MSLDICEGECDCCVHCIYATIKKDPEAWKAMEAASFAYTPLHRAAALGNAAVAVEILNLMPSLGMKLDAEGWSPLHLAVRGGRRDTAVRMARFDKRLVRVKGRGGMTPLMECAARAGSSGGDDDPDLELLARLLLACPESVLDVNNHTKTVVHVAIENRRCDAVRVLVNWLRRRDRIAAVLVVKDHEGNTALHAVARYGCRKGAESIVSLVKLNRLNSDKMTALDVAKEFNQSDMIELLEKHGAKSKCEIFVPQTRTRYVLGEASFPEAVSRFYYNLSAELTLEMRNAILVVAALIVTATYQGVLQPPGGVYPPPSQDSTSSSTTTTTIAAAAARLVGNEAMQMNLTGRMVMEEAHYQYFMPFNTFGFALSVVIIIFVVPSSPIFVILHLCLVFMSLSYLLALDAISRYVGISHMIFYMAVYAIFGAYSVKLAYYPIKALLVDKDWWLHFYSVRFANFASGTRGRCAKAVLEKLLKMKTQYQVLCLE